MSMDQRAVTVPAAAPRVRGGIIKRVRRVPGESGISIFILLDMLIFTEMFCIFAWYRAENRELFQSSQQAVNPVYGLAYTGLLLTSSWCIVMAVSCGAEERFRRGVPIRPMGFRVGGSLRGDQVRRVRPEIPRRHHTSDK